MELARPIYGLLAEFEEHDQLIAAAKEAHRQGYQRMDGYTPFPVEGLAEALGLEKTRIPLLVLLGGIVGGSGGHFMEWFANVLGYPLNIGGRPHNAWPMFIPITFELTILCAALSGFFGSLLLNKLPQPYHPVFNVPNFERASIDRFFLCIEATDPKFDSVTTRAFLEQFHPVSISEVAK